jgi:hypothetical protein
MNALTSQARLWGLVVAFGSITIAPIVLTASPSQALPKTTFACVRQGTTYATVAIRGDRQTAPMITWKDASHGPDFTPEKRCKIVSQRLTKAVARTSKLKSLTMAHGRIDSVPVICYITRKGETCNSENVLFSLKTSEIGQEQKILENLLSFSKKGTGSSIEESSGGADSNVEDWIENNLTTATDPNKTNKPIEQPNQF